MRIARLLAVFCCCEWPFETRSATTRWNGPTSARSREHPRGEHSGGVARHHSKTLEHRKTSCRAVDRADACACFGAYRFTTAGALANGTMAHIYLSFSYSHPSRWPKDSRERVARLLLVSLRMCVCAQALFLLLRMEIRAHSYVSRHGTIISPIDDCANVCSFISLLVYFC